MCDDDCYFVIPKKYLKHAQSPDRLFRCDVCGQFIPINDFGNGQAIRRLLTPDSEYTKETYETLCKRHKDQSCNHSSLQKSSNSSP